MSSTLTVTNANTTNLTTTNVTATNLTDGGGTTSTFANVRAGSLKSYIFGDTVGNTLKSLNVSGGVENSTGNYTYSFTSAMDSVNYSCGCAANSGNDRSVMTNTKTASSYIVEVAQQNGNAVSSSHSSNVAGDLA